MINVLLFQDLYVSLRNSNFAIPSVLIKCGISDNLNEFQDDDAEELSLSKSVSKTANLGSIKAMTAARKQLSQFKNDHVNKDGR